MIDCAVERSNLLAFEPAAPTGDRILIVEDEVFIALGVADAVLSLDASPVVAARVAKALELIAAERFDAAIVDLRLGGETADAVLDALSARDIPIVLTTGYCAEAVPEKYRGLPMLFKPYMTEQLEEALLYVLAPAKMRVRSA
jgi:CheY-like chemotaxis protein